MSFKGNALIFILANKPWTELFKAEVTCYTAAGHLNENEQDLMLNEQNIKSHEDKVIKIHQTR